VAQQQQQSSQQFHGSSATSPHDGMSLYHGMAVSSITDQLAEFKMFGASLNDEYEYDDWWGESHYVGGHGEQWQCWRTVGRQQLDTHFFANLRKNESNKESKGINSKLLDLL
jgi:hypothetical protein